MSVYFLQISSSISKPIREKTLLALMPFVPKLTLNLDGDSRDNLMQVRLYFLSSFDSYSI